MLKSVHDEVSDALKNFLNGLSDNLNAVKLLVDMAEHGSRQYHPGQTMPLNRSIKLLFLLNSIPLALCATKRISHSFLAFLFSDATASSISFWLLAAPLLIAQIARVPFNVDLIGNLTSEILNIHHCPKNTKPFQKAAAQSLYCALAYFTRSIQCTLCSAIPFIGPTLSFLLTSILTADAAFEYGQDPFAANRRCINEKAYFCGFGLALTSISFYFASSSTMPFFVNDAVFMFLLPCLIAAAQYKNEGLELAILKRPTIRPQPSLFSNANLFWPSDIMLAKTIKYITPKKVKTKQTQPKSNKGGTQRQLETMTL